MKIKKWKALTAILISLLLLTGCSNSSNNQTKIDQSSLGTEESATGSDNATGNSSTASPEDGSKESTSEDAMTTNSIKSISEEFDSEDYYNNEIPEAATKIVLNNTSAEISGSGAAADGSVITISSAGVYVVSGTLADGQILVNAQENEEVQIILNKVTLHSSGSAPIYIKSADKVIISLPEGTENSLTDTANYVFSDTTSDEPNSTIFSKANLLINGSGSLTVAANYNNAVNSRDNLKILGSKLKISSVDDGILGKDKVVIKDAAITVTADGDGIKATNSEAAEKGYVMIENSDLTITAGTDAIHSNSSITISDASIDISSGDDGIHADTKITILSGTVNIKKSYEGIESSAITIEDGNISLSSDDDGFNVSGGADSSSLNRSGENTFTASTDNNLIINGGLIYVNAAGDGLDSNGNIYINGGTILVNGPTNDGNGPMDYQGSSEITGGYLIAAGSSGMAQAPGETSSQYSIGVLFTQTQSAGTLVHIEDSSGKDIVTFAPAKDFASLVISSSEIRSGETYTVFTEGSYTGTQANGLYTGGNYKSGTKMVEFKVSDVVTWVNESGITTHSEGFGGGMGGRQKGDRGAFPGGKPLPGGAAPDDKPLPGGAAPDGTSGATVPEDTAFTD